MVKLVWDDKLMQVAKNYAAKCQWQHNSNRASDYQAAGGSGSVGENLYAGTFSSTAHTKAVQLWDDEKSDYTYSSNSCGSGKVCGHYTQVAWATSTRVGCWTQVCDQISGLSWSARSNGYQIVVCNYNPAGNYVGRSPYISGTRCSQCPSSASGCDNGLCTSGASSGIGGSDDASGSTGGTGGSSTSGGTQGGASGSSSSDDGSGSSGPSFTTIAVVAGVVFGVMAIVVLSVVGYMKMKAHRAENQQVEMVNPMQYSQTAQTPAYGWEY